MRTTINLPAALSIVCCVAGLAMTQSAYAEEGWYVRGEAGLNMLATGEGYWQGPGAADPRITWSLNDPVTWTGAVGLGYDWNNGFRVDKSIGIVGSMQVDGTFQSASDGSPATDHATDIHAPVSAIYAMGNIFVEPLKLSGSDSPVQPFLTAGLGVANVSMGEWTRNRPNHPDPTRVTRSFSGDSQVNLAWSVGAGVSFELEDLLGSEGYLDLTYRYTDLGQAQGGDVSTGVGSSSPVEPFNFRLASHALTIGLRMPLGK